MTTTTTTNEEYTAAAMLRHMDRLEDGPCMVLLTLSVAMTVVARKLAEQVDEATGGFARQLTDDARRAMLAVSHDAMEATMNVVAGRIMNVVEAISREARDTRQVRA